MKLDRALQLEILNQCRDVYPEELNLDQERQESDRNYLGNVAYLYQHGLIACPSNQEEAFGLELFLVARITVKGLDFLEDDGGISAILNTVTVKFDPDDLRSMLSAKAAKASIPDDQKRRLIEVIKSLPADLLKKITQDLLHQAVERLPDAIHIIQKGAHLLS